MAVPPLTLSEPREGQEVSAATLTARGGRQLVDEARKAPINLDGDPDARRDAIALVPISPREPCAAGRRRGPRKAHREAPLPHPPDVASPRLGAGRPPVP